MVHALLASLTLLHPAQPEPSPETAWLRDHAFPLAAVEAGHGFDDLRPLRALIGDARIVSLGEPTHGTREAFQLKHRLLEYLVTELGFTLFSIEASSPESFRLNDYVLRGEGDPRALIKGMYFWTWDTEEVLAMVEWMRTHNQAAAAAGRPPVRFTGFDMQTDTVALAIAREAVAVAEPDFLAEFDRLARVAAQPNAPADGAPPAIITARAPGALARGSRLTLTGKLRTRDVIGHAALWMRVDDAGGNVLAFDNMHTRGRTGTTDWTACTIELDVPASAHAIYFGILAPISAGTAWYDDLSLSLPDRTLSLPGDLDLGFESGAVPPAGFAMAAPGFEIRPDRENPAQGRCCLRISKDAPQPPAAPPPPAQPDDAPLPSPRDAAEALARRFVDHRAVYARALGPERAEWAAHNAEIVAQGARLRLAMTLNDPPPELHRDYAMAQNVRWLLDQHPGERAVLWAHNGHVSRAPWAMGAFLEDIYPGSQIVIGFSTSTGGYTAIRSGVGLADNRLQAPPARSAEARFDALPWPRFIADLRAADASDPASAWLTSPTPFRMVGALAMDRQFVPTTLRPHFDLIAHIRETTPSRSLGGVLKKE
ncbi:MAG: hypothetical protein DYG92_04870 [Leptolyngbya sp. PLA1]|nr:hypothetical protein [Leptolyngbya sp. PLA1]